MLSKVAVESLQLSTINKVKSVTLPSTSRRLVFYLFMHRQLQTADSVQLYY